MTKLDHERVTMVTGRRSGLTVIVSVHSTALGQAVGGCRLWRYADWGLALDDALRLSSAMTLKCALAGLPLGGGKSVIALPLDLSLTPQLRRDVMLDLGDVIDSLGGSYGRRRGRGHHGRGHARRPRAHRLRLRPAGQLRRHR